MGLLGFDTLGSWDLHAKDTVWLISLIYSSTSTTKRARRGTNEGRWRNWHTELRFTPSFISIYAHKNTITAPHSLPTAHLCLALFQMQSSNYQAIKLILWLHAGHFLCKYRWSVAWSDKWAPVKTCLIIGRVSSRVGIRDLILPQHGRSARMTLPWGVKCWWVQSRADRSLAPCPYTTTQGCRKDMDISAKSGSQKGLTSQGWKVIMFSLNSHHSGNL